MASERKNKGFEIALLAARSSHNSMSRAVASGFKLCERISEKPDYGTWTSGEIPIGFIKDGGAKKPVLLRLNLAWLPRNTLILGRSGSGKSHLCKVILHGLMSHLNVMVFDRLKDYTDSFKTKDVIVIPAENLRINPLEAPRGVPYEKWIEYLSSVFVHSMLLTDVSRGSMMQLIKYAGEKFKPDNGICSLYELKLAIGDLKSRYLKEFSRLAYWSRLEDRIDNVLHSPLGRIFGCYKGHDLETLLSKNVIIDVSGLAAHSVRVLESVMMNSIFCYRLFNNQGGHPIHAVVIEEAEDVFGEKAKGIIENPMDDVVRRIRGRGECLIMLNQSYKSLNPGLRANAFTHIMLGMSRPDERFELGRAMGLEEEQWEDAVMLDRPDAFVSIEGKKPVLISIPPYHSAKTPADEKRFVDCPEFFPFEPVPDAIIMKATQQKAAQEKLSLREVKDAKEVLDNRKALMLLLDIAKNPFIPFSSRQGTGFSKSKNDGFRIMKQCCESLLLRKVYIKSTTGRGQPALYLELTKQGLELLRESGKWKRESYYRGKMSFSGSLIIHTLLEPYYRTLGYETHVEGFLKGADCDLGVMGDNNTLDIAVELSITTDAKHEIHNVRRNFKAGWEKTVIIVASFEEKDGSLVHSDILSEKKREAFTRYFSVNLSIAENQLVEIKTIKDYRRGI